MTERRKVTLVESSYQPRKAELEEKIPFPEDMTPEELARLVTRTVDIKWVKKPDD